MSNNKITKLSYFAKRLRDSGYSLINLDIPYTELDPREWTILIDSGRGNVFCTLYKNASPVDIKESSIGDFYFELYDGGQFLPTNIKYKTSSIEVIISYLVQHGITGKNTIVNK